MSNDRLGWAVCAVLGALIAGQLWHRFSPPRFATLPILVPVTTEFEDAARARQGQPATRAVEEALSVIKRIDAAPLTEAQRTQLRTLLPPLQTAQAALLDLRNQRHTLNIALMDVGVQMVSVLTPAQWDRVHMARDATRARADAATFDKLLEKLR